MLKRFAAAHIGPRADEAAVLAKLAPIVRKIAS